MIEYLLEVIIAIENIAYIHPKLSCPLYSHFLVRQ